MSNLFTSEPNDLEKSHFQTEWQLSRLHRDIGFVVSQLHKPLIAGEDDPQLIIEMLNLCIWEFCLASNTINLNLHNLTDNELIAVIWFMYSSQLTAIFQFERNEQPLLNSSRLSVLSELRHKHRRQAKEIIEYTLIHDQAAIAQLDLTALLNSHMFEHIDVKLIHEIYTSDY